jgi:hypothetical protein
MFMLIDTRSPPPWPLAEDERRALEPNWRIWTWLLLAVVLFVVSFLQSPLAGAVLLFAAFACAMKALGAALERCDGIRAHKQ